MRVNFFVEGGDMNTFTSQAVSEKRHLWVHVCPGSVMCEVLESVAWP